MNVTLICDASYCHEHKIAGYGYWIACERGKEGGEGVVAMDVENNNTAEMMAICNTIWHGLSKGLILRYDKVLIQSDCTAALDKLGHKYAVTTLQEKLVLAYFEKTVMQHQLKVEFRHVKGHTVNVEARFAANRMCDKRAKRAMRKERTRRVASKYIKQIEEILK